MSYVLANEFWYHHIVVIGLYFIGIVARTRTPIWPAWAEIKRNYCELLAQTFGESAKTAGLKPKASGHVDGLMVILIALLVQKI